MAIALKFYQHVTSFCKVYFYPCYLKFEGLLVSTDFCPDVTVYFVVVK